MCSAKRYATCSTFVMRKKAETPLNWALCGSFRIGFKVILLGKFQIQIIQDKEHPWNQQMVLVKGIMPYSGKILLYEIGNPREREIQLKNNFLNYLQSLQLKAWNLQCKVNTMKMYWLLLNYTVKAIKITVANSFISSWVRSTLLSKIQLFFWLNSSGKPEILGLL